MLSIFLALTTAIPGGWEKVGFESEYVQTAMHYLNSRYMRLLPEFENRNTLLAFQEAEIQIVNGYNIRLTAKLGFTPYTFSLHVGRPGSENGEQKIKLTGIECKEANVEGGMMGGWRVQENSYEPELVEKVFGAYASENGINAKLGHVVFIRTQVVAGLNVHVVFEDSEENTHSLMVYIDVEQKIHIKFSSIM